MITAPARMEDPSGLEAKTKPRESATHSKHPTLRFQGIMQGGLLRWRSPAELLYAAVSALLVMGRG